MHAPANSENRIEWADIFDTKSFEERHLMLRDHALGVWNCGTDVGPLQAEGADFALVWPSRFN